jgi:hypothetical protein
VTGPAEAILWERLMYYSPQHRRELIDAFAHELAEKIRADFERGNGMYEAADLIDPEVNK